MKKITNGGFAVAEAVKVCKPAVAALYPITPSTFVPEKITEFVNNGELDTEIILTECEFSSLSACIGASATGVRSFTATASQGLALMHEVLFAAAGMRLPVVIVVGNRALSAPLNIWNDWSDSIAERDSGALQFYAETNQEAVDLVIQAYKIAENENVLLPALVNFDGFWLTHTYEPVDIPDSVKGFLPDFKPTKLYLDVKKPMTQGTWASPKFFQQLKQAQEEAIQNSKKIIIQANEEFSKKFVRKYGNGLVENYKSADTMFVSMGSICGSIKEICDSEGCGLLRIRTYRPFPIDDIKKELSNAKTIIVLEKDISLGSKSGALFHEIRSALYGSSAKIVGIVAGLGGKDTTLEDLKQILKDSEKMKDGEVKWTK